MATNTRLSFSHLIGYEGWISILINYIPSADNVLLFRLLKKEVTVSGVRKYAKEMKRDKLILAAISENHTHETKKYRLILSDMKELSPKIGSQVDAIITDPPYEEKYLSVYGELAQAARLLLSPGGALVVMIGHSHLPEVLALMTPHIDYLWTVAYLTPANTARVFSAKAMVNWKPVLVFSNGPYQGDWYTDVVSNSAVDKRFHEWGQGESGMAELIERYSLPGQTILDPFCGASTTGVAAIKMNRFYVGADNDADAIAISAKRLSENEMA